MPTSDAIFHLIINKNSTYYPILGFELDSTNVFEMDFTEANSELLAIDLLNTKAFSDYVFHSLEKSGKLFGIGGYAEKRAIYRRSVHFNREDEPRNIHLGVDIWAIPETPIFCSISGIVHSFQNNNNFGDYGPTLILEHNVAGIIFYTLYGHLSIKSIENLYFGQQFLAGDLLCEIGNYPENGNWPPHLHFQIIKDLGDYWGDYPGVCKESEKEIYLSNCPNPNFILKML